MSRNEKGHSGSAYEVGRCKPPGEHQFQKGQSGNPNGRPRKEKVIDHCNLTDLLIDTANEIVMVTIQGEPVQLMKKAAIVLGVVNDAMAGTPPQRIRAFQALASAGAFNVPSRSTVPSEEARRKFLEDLAEEARSEELLFARQAEN